MADEDNTQSERETQNLLKKLDECITKFDQKRQVLQDAIESEIEAVKKDQKETREIRSTLVHEPGDTSSNLEAGSREIASTVKQWLNQKALIGGDATGDQDQGDTYSVLIVDDDRNARDAIQRYTIRIGEQKHCTMEFQEAKNGKEAVYLHLAGASFDLIVMDDHMPIMTGIQATQLLRKMGVKSQIVGVTSEPDHQAFIDAGFNTCVRKPRSIA
ncbi:oxidative stress response two-component system protein [Salix suchowensis]|nr:oxidative stress response two-component system protein [Salix suchowensis]